jgi:DNA mismatch repair ATPase MutS
MIDVARYVRGMKKCYEISQAYKELAVIDSQANLAQLQGSPKNSDQFNKLLSMLDHNTFMGNPSFFSLTGRVLASYKVMKEAKAEFTHALEAAGELDAYLSMAKLLKEFSHKRVGYCSVQFAERNKPMIQAIDFWNPFVSPDIVVTNSLWMGTDAYSSNVVITGPNTGGKSTVVKGVLLALVLAQTFGVAPAKELIMTSFVKLNCHLNITDDIAAGTSLFKAEVLKAKELINGVRALKPNEFSCTAMDEAFNGTEIGRLKLLKKKMAA